MSSRLTDLRQALSLPLASCRDWQPIEEEGGKEKIKGKNKK